MTVCLFVSSCPRVGKAAAEFSVGVAGDLYIDQRKIGYLNTVAIRVLTLNERSFVEYSSGPLWFTAKIS